MGQMTQPTVPKHWSEGR